MKYIKTQGIVLSRTDFGEADRIIKFLTSDYGKISGIAKAVRKSKSKLAGGIELFSISDLSFVVGKGEVYTITSARLVSHFDNIVKDIERTNTGYEFLKIINKTTADHPDESYFKLLTVAFGALDDNDIDLGLTNLWFNMQLIKLAGRQPDLYEDTGNMKLDGKKKYIFDSEKMKFTPSDTGRANFDANNIKFLRLGFSSTSPQILSRVKEKSAYIDLALSFVKNLQLMN